MTYDPEKRRRPSLRLPTYDYRRSGVYFVTICTKDAECLFGEVVEGRMRRSAVGHIAYSCWYEIPDHFPHVRLDRPPDDERDEASFVVMPNHVHGILTIMRDGDDARERSDERRGNDADGADTASHGGAVSRGGTTSRGGTKPRRGTIYRAPTADEPPTSENADPPPATPHSENRPIREFGKPQAGSLSTIIRTYKAAVTRFARRGACPYFAWHRNFYEHVVRNEADLRRIRRYIAANPARWDEDRIHPKNR